MSTPSEPCFALREVYYDDAGLPAAHGEPFMNGDDLGELRALLPRLATALELPVLSEKDFVGQMGDSPGKN